MRKMQIDTQVSVSLLRHASSLFHRHLRILSSIIVWRLYIIIYCIYKTVEYLVISKPGCVVAFLTMYNTL